MKHPWSNLIDVLCWVVLIPTSAVLAFRAYARSDSRRSLVLKWIISVPLIWILLILIHLHDNPYVPIYVLLPAIILGCMWAPGVGSLMSSFMGDYSRGDDNIKTKPFYFLAEGKRRKGLYDEAIAEVQRQLAQFPGDYEGYLKMASIQMESQKSLPAAQATLIEFVGLPNREPKEVVGALQLLADWQLQFGKDAQAARISLEQVVERFPGTPYAHAAAQRIARLGSADETRRAREEKKFQVTPRERDIGLRKEATPEAAAVDPAILAQEYVRQLELHPSDTATREKLAVLYAEQFQRVDLAAAQLEQLIAMPAEPPKHIAHWLNLLATLHVKVGNDLEAAQNALRRIASRLPEGALASMAARRLATLASELKTSQPTPAKAMPKSNLNLLQ